MIDTYIKQFSQLHSDASPARWTAATRHRAPHKPLLLLSVLDLFSEGSLTSNLIELSIELSESFTRYWSRLMPPDKRSSIALPFFHMRSERFWHLRAQPGRELVLSVLQRIQTTSQLRDNVTGAELDDELYDLLQNEDTRKMLRAVLIETYFSRDAQAILLEQGEINREAFVYSQQLLEQARGQSTILNVETHRPAVRDQAFRRVVVIAYTHQCAVCGLRILTPESHTAVDAAHIVPWSVTFNDNPRNGMALCQLCHWIFDEGLLSISGLYQVTLSRLLSTNGNLINHLADRESMVIHRPMERALWPDVEALHWHRRNVFRLR